MCIESMVIAYCGGMNIIAMVISYYARGIIVAEVITYFGRTNKAAQNVEGLIVWPWY